TNTQDNLIKQEIKNKLELVKLPEHEEQMIKFFLANNSDKAAEAKLQEKLINQGQWKARNPDFLAGANISVCLSDRFMAAVKNDEDWDLVFPDLANYSPAEKEIYDREWSQVGEAYEWEQKGYKLKKYYTIKARELWNLIIFCATHSAEPGIFFFDRANQFTNVKGYGQKVVATNPCGEQPLAPYSVCNLSAVNLASFVDKKTSQIKWDELRETVENCIRFQDNIIDASYYFLEKNTIQAQGERRIGLGVMGLHDFLIYAGLRYGSPKANLLVDKLFETICRTAYETSITLAQEKGSFPFLTDKNNLVEKSAFIRSLPGDIQEKIRKYGLRNSHLLTVAPTGSTGTLVGVSTGLEPYFAFSHYRSGRLGKWIKVDYPIVNEWLKFHPEYSADNLPDIFVSAMELTPEEHVDIQCIIQRWLDGSISKTINAPRGYSVAQVKKIYERLYNKGAKGGTVYVDGSRDFQVLSLEKNDNQFAELKKKDQCHTCGEGELIWANGCQTCSNCQLQVKCDI
ncbi:MAG: ribonucleotide-diphosphate reductase subunit alpha, partial [Mycoplasmataceae bacterium RV_VA103A]